MRPVPVAVRVRVLFGRTAGRPPARVSDAGRDRPPVDSDGLFEIRQLAGRPAQRNPLRVTTATPAES